jgi:hypothetical protein
VASTSCHDDNVFLLAQSGSPYDSLSKNPHFYCFVIRKATGLAQIYELAVLVAKGESERMSANDVRQSEC